MTSALGLLAIRFASAMAAALGCHVSAHQCCSLCMLHYEALLHPSLNGWLMVCVCGNTHGWHPPQVIVLCYSRYVNALVGFRHGAVTGMVPWSCRLKCRQLCLPTPHCLSAPQLLPCRYTSVSEVFVKPNPKGSAKPQVQKEAEAEKVRRVAQHDGG